MSEESLIMGIIVVILTTSLFSGIGVLIFLFIRSIKLPRLNIGAGGYVFQFIFTVTSGVVTYFITDLLFGHGTEHASATAIATAVTIGTITRFIGGTDTSIG